MSRKNRYQKGEIMIKFEIGNYCSDDGNIFAVVKRTEKTISVESNGKISVHKVKQDQIWSVRAYEWDVVDSEYFEVSHRTRVRKDCKSKGFIETCYAINKVSY